MVKVRWKLEEVVVTSGDDGGSDPLPVVQFDSATYQIGEEYSDSTGKLFGVTATLDKAWTSTVTVPYVLTGDATYLADYWKGTNETNNTPDPTVELEGGGYGQYFRFNAGTTSATHWFWIVNDSGPGAPVDEDFILTMAESITFSTGTVIPLTDATIGATSSTTVTIIDDDSGGLPTVSWEVGALTRSEGDTTTVVTVNLVLSSANPPNAAVTVSIDGATTATDTVDFDVVEASYTFGTKTTRGVPITIYGDTDTETDETVVLTLSSPVDCVLGAVTTFTLTIANDDGGAHETATVSLDAGNPTLIPEGDTRSWRVNYSGTTGHDPFEVTFGIQPLTATVDDYTVLTTSPLAFGTNDLSKDINILANIGDGQEADETFRVRLLSLADADGGTAVGDGDITLTAPTTQNVTILDGDQGGGAGVDGDLKRWDGTQLIPERRTFDPLSPHFRVSYPGDPAHGFATEAYQVLTSAVPGKTSGQWYSVSSGASALEEAMRLAEYVWRDMYGGTYTDPDDVPVGTELDEVLIEVKVSSVVAGYGWDQPRLKDTYRYNSAPNLYFSSDRVGWVAVNPSNIAVRDIIVYGDGVTRQVLETPNIPAWYLRNDVLIDNIRFERLQLTGGYTDTTVKKVSGGDIGTGPNNASSVRYHGRLKMYDCQLHPSVWRVDDGVYGGHDGGLSNIPLWTIRSNPVCLDIRHPLTPLPWYPVYPSKEHHIYVDSPPGPDMYPALDFAVALVNFRVPSRNHPSHELATVSGGAYVGPYYTAERTVLQVVNRPEYNRDIATGTYGKASSGLIALVRVNVSEHGASYTPNGGEALKIHGHSGEIYYKDCKATGSTRPGREGVATAFTSLTIDNFTASGSLGPDGCYLIDYDGNDVLFTQETLTVDGVDIAGTNTKKPWFSMIGPRTVKLRKFRFHNLSGGREQMAISNVTVGGITGCGFTRYWDTADLIVQNADGTDGAAYTGAFSAYPGWGSSGSKIDDYYFQNWLRQGFTDKKSLTTSDLDNLATTGPAGYAQTNGLIAQRYTGRLGEQATGFVIDPSQGSPAWTSSAYTDAGENPTLPTLDLTESVVWIGENDADGTIESQGTLFWEDKSMLKLRVKGTVTIPGSMPNSTVRYSAQTMQDDYPNDTQEWVDISGSFSFDWYPIQGRIGNAGQTVNANSEAFLNSQGLTWQPDAIAFQVRPNALLALSSGTKDISLDLLDGVNRPQWEYPYGSGTFQNAAFVGGGEITVHVVPAVDYAQDGFTIPSLTLDPGALTNGQTIPIQLERRSIGNQDAMHLAGYSSIAAGGTVPQEAYQFVSLVPWSAVPSGDSSTVSQVQSASLQILDKSKIGDGDTLTFTLQYVDDSQHVQAETQQDLYGTYTLLFESADPVVQWDGLAAETLDELTSGVYSIGLADTATQTYTVGVQLGGSAGSSQWNSGGTNDYATSPAPNSSGLVSLQILSGQKSASITVNTGNVTGDKLLTMQIVSAPGLTIGSKDTKSVTIDDLDTSNKPDAGGNTGPRTDIRWDVGDTAKIDNAWLSANSSAHPNEVYQEGGRWIVEAVSFGGNVRIPASNVTLRDCLIDGGSGSQGPSWESCIRANTNNVPGDNILFEYCELRENWAQVVDWTGGGSHPMEMSWCWIHDIGGDGFNGSAITLRNCYLERFAIDTESSNPHADLAQIRVGYMRFYSCVFNQPAPPVAPSRSSNGCVFAGTEKGSINGVVMDGCWFNGGNHTLQLGNAADLSQTWSNGILRNCWFGPEVRAGLLLYTGTINKSNAWAQISGNRWDTDTSWASGRQAYRQDGTPCAGELILPTDKVDDWETPGGYLTVGFNQD